MRVLIRAALCLIVLLPLSAIAQNSGPSSNGEFQFALEGASGAIQYNARTQGTSASGQMTFTGAVEVSNEDVDGEGTSESALTSVNVTVEFNCLKINGNRAAMSGIVTASSHAPYVGKRAILAVEDGGEGKNAEPDRFTWGVYRLNGMSWTPEDAEVPGDPGWSFSWYATDAERNDDVPVLISGPKGPIDCNSFPFGSYAFEALPHGAGNIQVKH